MSDLSSGPAFEPALSVPEAIERIYSVTGRAPDDSRGEKRALVALRDSLGLDVDLARTNAVLGKTLADALDVEWVPADHVVKNKVTLDGLNVLLEGAARAKKAGSLQRARNEAPDALVGPQWADFNPARSKIEAVTRIAALTRSPKEWLGPGGKEHKSVLINLADRLLPDADLNRSSKTKMAASIAAELGAPWTDRCESTGETISLTGLNTILAGAERRLGLLGAEITDVVTTPEDEGAALAAAIFAHLPRPWDGRKVIEWFRDNGYTNMFKHSEWPGWYGEVRAKKILEAAFTPREDPPQTRYGNTVFDYALNHVWDIKVHTERKVFVDRNIAGDNGILLNDWEATVACIEQQGLGFLMISGDAIMDETGEFYWWHQGVKGKPTEGERSPKSRPRKSGFVPTQVDAMWLPDLLVMEAAVLAGNFAMVKQPPQQDRSPRRPKSSMKFRQFREAHQVASHRWPGG